MPFSINREKCIGCDACRLTCPTQAISGLQYEKHVIDPELCVSCGLCADFCENKAIYDNRGKLAEFCSWEDWGIPEVDAEICTGCSLCVETCPMYVLKINEPEFHGDIRTHAVLTDKDLCIGCEKCAARCPIHAIKIIPRV